MVLKIREYAGRRLLNVDCRLVNGEFTGHSIFSPHFSLSFYQSVCRRDACVRRVPVAFLLIRANSRHSWACFDLRRIYDLFYPQKEDFGP